MFPHSETHSVAGTTVSGSTWNLAYLTKLFLLAFEKFEVDHDGITTLFVQFERVENFDCAALLLSKKSSDDLEVVRISGVKSSRRCSETPPRL